jgi:hypothetical protein
VRRRLVLLASMGGLQGIPLAVGVFFCACAEIDPL